MNEDEQGMYDMGLLLGTGNPLFWQCDKCGWKTARHPATKPEDMPPCHQHAPAKVIGRKWNEYTRRTEDVYQYNCGGKMVAKVLTSQAAPATVSA